MQKTVVVAIDHMHWVPKLKGYRKRTNKLKVRKALGHGLQLVSSKHNQRLLDTFCKPHEPAMPWPSGSVMLRTACGVWMLMQLLRRAAEGHAVKDACMQPALCHICHAMPGTLQAALLHCQR
jgi:hypothetical protein